MEANIFDQFFKRTLWSEKTPAPSYDELTSMENEFMEALLAMKTSGDYQVYRYHFSQKGKQVISRIGFYLRTLDANHENTDIKRLRDSYTRLREALKSLDRKLYESELRADIQKGKRMRKKTIEDLEKVLSHQQNGPAIKESKVPHFKKMTVPKDKLEPLYYDLISRKWLNKHTPLNDFIYYFCGEGDEPSELMKWEGKQIMLAILLSYIDGRTPEWKVIESVFADVNRNSLKSMLSKASMECGRTFLNHRETIERLLQSIGIITK